MWRWWYIVSLFTKQCWKKKVECKVDVGSMYGRCGVDVVMDGKIYRINEEEEEGK